MTTSTVEFVRQLNPRTRVCRHPAVGLFVAKRESVHDEAIVLDRIELVDLLRERGFPCPAIVEVDGRRYARENGEFVIHYEYLDFSRVNKGHMYRATTVRDSIRLLCEFQSAAGQRRDESLGDRFRPSLEDYLTARRDEARLGQQADVLAVIDWVAEHLEAIDRLEKIPCHASFRHHNLFYDEQGRLCLIDFFHGLYYAPRIYDLCVLLSIFPYGRPFGSPRTTLRGLMKDSPVAWLRDALRWGLYRASAVRHVVGSFAPTVEERDLLVPCFYLSLMRNNNFAVLARSAGTGAFIELLAQCLTTTNVPPRRQISRA